MLPQKLNWDLAQTQWAQQINPLLTNPISNGLILKSIALTSGTNVISHKLARPLQGWYPTRVRASATFYDLQDANQTPSLTLVLVSSADVTIDLAVF